MEGSRPVSSGHLGQRLKDLGIRPGQARSTALFQLASELPAALLARMLGVHIDVATTWQRLSSGDWMAYAADGLAETELFRHFQYLTVPLSIAIELGLAVAAATARLVSPDSETGASHLVRLGNRRMHSARGSGAC